MSRERGHRFGPVDPVARPTRTVFSGCISSALGVVRDRRYLLNDLMPLVSGSRSWVAAHPVPQAPQGNGATGGNAGKGGTAGTNGTAGAGGKGGAAGKAGTYGDGTAGTAGTDGASGSTAG
jgi:hypothetical protein